MPIPGSCRESRLHENAGTADVSLTPEEVAGIDAALDTALDTIDMSDVSGGPAAKR